MRIISIFLICIIFIMPAVNVTYAKKIELKLMGGLDLEKHQTEQSEQLSLESNIQEKLQNRGFYSTIGYIISAIWNAITGGSNNSTSAGNNNGGNDGSSPDPGDVYDPDSGDSGDPSATGPKTFIFVEPLYKSNNYVQGDIPVFKKYLEGTFKYHKKGKTVTRRSMDPTDKIDYVYFAGHGYAKGNKGYPTIPEWSGNSSVNKAFLPHDFKNNKVKNYLFMCCKSVQPNWKSAFSNTGLKTVLGYHENSYNGSIQNILVKKFAQMIKDVNPSNSYEILKKWIYANQRTTAETGSQWPKNRWAAVAYDKGGKLHYWKQSNLSSQQRTFDIKRVLRPVHEIKCDNGVISVLCELESPDIARTKSLEEQLYGRATQLVGTPENVDLSSLDSSMIKRAVPSVYSKVSRMASGGFVYTNPGSSGLPVSFNDIQAMDMAWNFVYQNGGMPNDARIGNVSQITKQALDGSGKTEVVGYVVNFIHELNGKPVVSHDGEGIVVTVEDSGVTHYQRMWTQITEKPASRSRVAKQKLSMKKCIQKAAPAMLSQMNELNINEIQVTHAETTYMTSNIDDEQRELKEVYCITAQGDYMFLVDPYTAELL